MKKFLSILIMCIALIISSINVFAAETVTKKPMVVDNAQLLNDTEKQDLTNELNQVSSKYNYDVVVVTVKSCEGKTPESYADEFFDDNGYGVGESHDGILFLVSMEQRDWQFSLSGACKEKISVSTTEAMGKKISEKLGSGNYYEAFSTYGTLVDEELGSESSDEQDMKIGAIAISWVIALIAALVSTGVMKSSLKSANKKIEANNYVGKDSLVLSVRDERFLYKRVDRTKKPKDNERKSSSGNSHSGAGGKF